MNLDELINHIDIQQEKEITGIPLGFDRFKEALPCVPKQSSIIILGGSGSGKTAFVIDKFLVNAVLFCKENPNLADIHIDYFNLEETEQRHDLRVLSNLAYRKLGVEYSLSEMENNGNKKKLKGKTSQFKKLQSDIDYINKKVTNHTCKTPSQINNAILDSCKKLEKEGTNFASDKFYYFVIIDNLKFLKRESKHKDVKDVIDDLCLNILQELRLSKYQIIPIVLQHTSVSQDNMIVNVNGSVIDNKLRPSLSSMGGSSDTQTPATLIYGLFFPFRYGIANYPTKDGYDINMLEGNARFLIPLKSRDSSIEGMNIPIYFKGNVSAFEELPPSQEFRTNRALYDKYKSPILS